jgi:hypothetical protein
MEQQPTTTKKKSRQEIRREKFRKEKEANTERGQTRDFFLRVTSFVNKIILFDTDTHKFMGFMKKLKIPEEQSEVVFNGTVNVPKFIACVLAGGGKANYTFNNLFSTPLDDKTLESLVLANEKEWINTVIINTPKDSAKFVFLEFPEVWQLFWEIPRYIFLYKAPLDKIKFDEDMEKSDENFRKIGIDPTGDSFVANIHLKVPDSDYLKTLDEGHLKKLLDTKIIIRCYSHFDKKHVKCDYKGNTEVLAE